MGVNVYTRGVICTIITPNGGGVILKKWKKAGIRRVVDACHGSTLLPPEDPHQAILNCCTLFAVSVIVCSKLPQILPSTLNFRFM